MAPDMHETSREREYNAAMRTYTDFRGTLDHLPEAAVLVLDGISWEEYEHYSKISRTAPECVSLTIREDWRS